MNKSTLTAIPCLIFEQLHWNIACDLRDLNTRRHLHCALAMTEVHDVRGRKIPELPIATPLQDIGNIFMTVRAK